MKIDLKKLLSARVDSIPFSGTLELQDEMLYGTKPFRLPVQFQGEITSRLDVLRLTAVMETTYFTTCARCLKPLSIPLSVNVDTLLVRKDDAQEEEDGVFLLEDDTAEIEEVLRPTLFLEIEMVYLCKPDCKGLCPHCGVDRNRTQCSCDGKQIDDRLAVLKSLLQ